MNLKSDDQLMIKIDKGIRAGVRKALQEHKKAEVGIAVWDNGRVKVIPPKKIRIKI
jgi:hypothetical protein